MTIIDDMALRNGSDFLLTRHEAAQKLGVSERRISALCHSGDLRTVATGGREIMIAAESVRKYSRWNSRKGRPYSAEMAFAVLYLLSGLDAPWLDAQQRYRARRYLSSASAEDVIWMCRKRATVVEYWAREVRLDDISQRIRISAGTGASAADFDLAETDFVEGYVAADTVESVVGECRMRRNVTPIRVRLRIADFLPEGEGAMPIAVCAADLAESDDERERYAGLQKLTAVLEEFAVSR